MTATYKVKAVKQLKDGTGDKGPYTVQKIRLENPQAENGITDVELFVPGTAPIPTEGSQLEGDIGDPFKPGGLPQFKRARKQGGFGGFGGGPRPEDPKKMASIAMQHSQSLAWEIVRFALENNLFKPPEASYDAVRDEVAATSRWLYRMTKDIQEGA
jgi:hypothetical protein